MHEYGPSTTYTLEPESYDELAVDPELIRDINAIGASVLNNTVELNTTLPTTGLTLNGVQMNINTPSAFTHKSLESDKPSKFDQQVDTDETSINTATLEGYGMSLQDMQSLKNDLDEKATKYYAAESAQQQIRQEQDTKDQIMLDILDTERQQAIRKSNSKKNVWSQKAHI